MRYGFAVDIGTTNVRIALCSLDERKILVEESEPNAQIKFGSDVITRVLYAHNNGVKPLTDAILSQLNESFYQLLKRSFISRDDVKLVCITGNSLMLHFAAGLSVSGFETAPFTTESLFGCTVSAKEVFSPLLSERRQLSIPEDTEIVFPPCASAFVGADVLCSWYSCTKSAAEMLEPVLLADIGTNCEIILSCKDGLFCCSAAAGPAFEGWGISCRKKGSELIEVLNHYLSDGIIDRTGQLCGEGLCGGSIFTQDDVRKLQLAKAAVCSGIETLLHEAGISAQNVGKFFICGNFGVALSAVSAEKIGLIPKGLASAASYKGDASLDGAIAVLFAEKPDTLLAEMKKTAETVKLVQLADNGYFSKCYIERINFPEK